jgi:hypothetical protein
MDNQEFNGWTNYATWRVNLEIFDDMTARDLSGERVNTNSVIAQMAEAHVQEILSSTSDGLALNYALAFIADVNWGEIAYSLMLGESEGDNEDEDG